MTTPCDGGPAFPATFWDNGMNLRDYFAGQALIGLAARMDAEMRKKYLDGKADGREAIVAYQLADAMLKARSAADAITTGPR